MRTASVFPDMFVRPSAFMPRAWWDEALAAFARVLGEETR